MNPPVRIVADFRERGSGVPERLAGNPEVALGLEPLAVGDYRVAEMALFERKTVADFARSLVDGRLFRQALHLAAQPLPATILLEGETPKEGPIEGVDRHAWQGAIASLSIIFRIPVIPTRDIEETADVLRYAAFQLTRVGTHAPPRFGSRPKGRRKRQLFILQGLPGIGPGRAEHLLDRFGSVERVMTAAEKDLADTPGIGRAIARAIREAVE